MPKLKKVKATEPLSVEIPEYKPSFSFDSSQIKNLKKTYGIGQNINITLRGKIKEIRQMNINSKDVLTYSIEIDKMSEPFTTHSKTETKKVITKKDKGTVWTREKNA